MFRGSLRHRVTSINFHLFLYDFPTVQRELLRTIIFRTNSVNIRVLGRHTKNFPIHHRTGLGMGGLIVKYHVCLRETTTRHLFNFFTLGHHRIKSCLRPHYFIPNSGTRSGNNFRSLRAIHIKSGSTFCIFSGITTSVWLTFTSTLQLIRGTSNGNSNVNGNGQLYTTRHRGGLLPRGVPMRDVNFFFR